LPRQTDHLKTTAGTSTTTLVSPGGPTKGGATGKLSGTTGKLGGTTGNLQQSGASNDALRSWPRGRLEEAPAVFLAVLSDLARLISWLIAAVARFIGWIVSLLAQGATWLLLRLSQGKLSKQTSTVLGWILAIALVLGALSGLAMNHRSELANWLTHIKQSTHFMPDSGSAKHLTPVPYVHPPASCTTPRLPCAAPTETLDGQPSISASSILTILQANNSPAATTEFAQSLYDLGVKYGVNPAYALGFFMEESTYGTRGIAANTLSIGNIRFTQSSSPISYTNNQGFRQYNSWRDGAEDWFWVIRTYYLDQGIRDIYDVTPIYAPVNDNNNPLAYARAVYQGVLQWTH
jgi:Mannosyl-glycoprotein endo-beta-N-acetylglucosaminidase